MEDVIDVIKRVKDELYTEDELDELVIEKHLDYQQYKQLLEHIRNCKNVRLKRFFNRELR